MAKPIYLVVTPFFPSPSRWQGAYILDQVKAIERTGRYKVVVFTPCNWRKQEEPYLYDGITVLRVKSFFMPSYLFNGVGGGYNGKQLIQALHNNDIYMYDISVVHCHTASFACFATAIKKIHPCVKTVLQYHDPDPYQVRNGMLATWKINAIFRAKKLINQFKYIDLHLCISEKVRYNLLNFPNPHPKESFDSYRAILNVLRNVKIRRDLNTYVLYNGVDTSLFHPIAHLKNPKIFKIGCIGNFIDWKDQMTLIKAIHYLVCQGEGSCIRVSFVGSGVTRKECEDYINKHELTAYFAFEQEVHHRDLPRYYNTLDLFVLPSYFEGFGCVFTEAAACGVPFMGCINQGYSEYIPEDDRDKWLINPGDYGKLADNIVTYMEAGYEQRLSKTFDIDMLVNDFLNYLQTL